MYLTLLGIGNQEKTSWPSKGQGRMMLDSISDYLLLRTLSLRLCCSSSASVTNSEMYLFLNLVKIPRYFFKTKTFPFQPFTCIHPEYFNSSSLFSCSLFDVRKNVLPL